jgi:hypothetical protein
MNDNNINQWCDQQRTWISGKLAAHLGQTALGLPNPTANGALQDGLGHTTLMSSGGCWEGGNVSRADISLSTSSKSQTLHLPPPPVRHLRSWLMHTKPRSSVPPLVAIGDGFDAKACDCFFGPHLLLLETHTLIKMLEPA